MTAVLDVVDDNTLAVEESVVLLMAVLDVTDSETIAESELAVLVVSVNAQDLLVTAFMGIHELGKMKIHRKKGQHLIYVSWEIRDYKGNSNNMYKTKSLYFHLIILT